jgi:hypothetical protein
MLKRLLVIALVASNATGCMSAIGYHSSGSLARSHNAERERAIARGDRDVEPADDVHNSQLVGLAVGAVVDAVLLGAFANHMLDSCVHPAGTSVPASC